MTKEMKSAVRYKIKQIFNLFLSTCPSCVFPLLFHIWLNNTFISFPTLLRVGRSTWCDAGNSQIQPLLSAVAVTAQQWKQCASTSPHFHHSLTFLSLLPPGFSLSNRRLFVVSEPTWLTVKHIWWHNQVEMNTLYSSLAVRYRWVVEMMNIHAGWNWPEGGLTDVIFIEGTKLTHVIIILVPWIF